MLLPIVLFSQKSKVPFLNIETPWADSVYNMLVTYYPESIKADNALFERAEIQRVRLSNNEEARKLYMILMTDYPESIYSGKARKQYRMLVGE